MDSYICQITFKLEIKRFKYSALQMLFGVLSLSFLAIFFYIKIITPDATYKSWEVFGSIMLIIGARFIYLCIIFLV